MKNREEILGKKSEWWIGNALLAIVLFGYETIFSFKTAWFEIYDSVIEANAKKKTFIMRT